MINSARSTVTLIPKLAKVSSRILIFSREQSSFSFWTDLCSFLSGGDLQKAVACDRGTHGRKINLNLFILKILLYIWNVKNQFEGGYLWFGTLPGIGGNRDVALDKISPVSKDLQEGSGRHVYSSCSFSHNSGFFFSFLTGLLFFSLDEAFLFLCSCFSMKDLN